MFLCYFSLNFCTSYYVNIYRISQSLVQSVCIRVIYPMMLCNSDVCCLNCFPSFSLRLSHKYDSLRPLYSTGMSHLQRRRTFTCDNLFLFRFAYGFSMIFRNVFPALFLGVQVSTALKASMA